MKSTKFTLLAAVVLSLCGAANAAKPADGYLSDSWGNVVKSSTSDLCVKTSSYTNATKHVDCDPVAVVTPAPAPAPIPVVIPAPIIKMVEKQYITEVNFTFNESNLSLEDKMKLEKFVADIYAQSGQKVNNVVVLGHADPIGKEKRNIPLSQERADVVAAFLSGKIPNISTYSFGSSRAKTECGKTPTKNNIICNADNRRTRVIVNAVIPVENSR